MGSDYRHSLPLEVVDPEMYDITTEEDRRIEEGLVMIASENYASKAVKSLLPSSHGFKYAEGSVGNRYYPGGINSDRVEKLAIERLLKLYGAEHANVQPLSGSPANNAVYLALIKMGKLKIGGTIMGFDLSSGGHLTHGSPASLSGILFNCENYNVSKKPEMEGRLDYTEIREMARTCKPGLIISGTTSYSREIDFAEFNDIAREVGAYHMADMAHIAGLIAGGAHPSPVPHADFVTGTTQKTLRGARGGFVLCRKEFANFVDKAVFPGLQGGPHMHVIAANAVAYKEALEPGFRDYSKCVKENAEYLAEYLMGLGHKIITGGTDTHMMLMDLTETGMTGRQAERWLEDAGIYANKNKIPFDERSSEETSGVRFGTPFLTTRGMEPPEMVFVADFINDILRFPGDKKIIAKTKEAVRQFCSDFPLYTELPEGYKMKELPTREFERA